MTAVAVDFELDVGNTAPEVNQGITIFRAIKLGDYVQDLLSVYEWRKVNNWPLAMLFIVCLNTYATLVFL